jgi:hypothetical protein
MSWFVIKMLEWSLLHLMKTSRWLILLFVIIQALYLPFRPNVSGIRSSSTSSSKPNSGAQCCGYANLSVGNSTYTSAKYYNFMFAQAPPDLIF